MIVMNTWLARPLSIIEIWATLSELDADSCPRIDGLTPHFSTNLWDIIKENLLQAYEEIITFGNMPKAFGQGSPRQPFLVMERISPCQAYQQQGFCGAYRFRESI